MKGCYILRPEGYSIEPVEASDIRIVEVKGSTPMCSTETLQIKVCKVFSYLFYADNSMQILHSGF